MTIKHICDICGDELTGDCCEAHPDAAVMSVRVESTDAETIWNSTFGPDATPATVLAECETQSITPQDYAMTCIVDAREAGFDCDKSAAFASLCRQLGVTGG